MTDKIRYTRGSIGWFVLAAAFLVPGALFFNWWSRLNTDSKAARSSSRHLPRAPLFEAPPPAERLVNPANDAPKTPPAAPPPAKIPSPAQAPAQSPAKKPAPQAAPVAATPAAESLADTVIQNDPFMSPYDRWQLKQEELDRLQTSRPRPHRARPKPAVRLPELELQGITLMPEREPKAIVNGAVLGVGDRVKGAKIIRITSDSVTFSFSGKKFTKTMPTSGGAP